MLEYLAGVMQGGKSMSLSDELAEIETMVRKSEEAINTGAISAERIVRRIREIADPDAQMAACQAAISMLTSHLNQMSLPRLQALKLQHSEDSRIDQLGRKAAKCSIELSEIMCSAGETLSPGMRTTLRYQNQTMKDSFEKMINEIFTGR